MLPALRLFAFIAAMAAMLHAGDVRTPVTLPRSEVRTFVSSATGREHRVFIAWPDSPAPATGFPVIYVLDANAWFSTVVETNRVLAGRPEGTGVRPAIIVGLGYPIESPFDNARRTADYTAPGADAFLGFIENEVKPAVARDYSIDPAQQTLLGHSLGGHFVLRVLFTAPSSFSNYIALSPSIWWHDRALLANESALVSRLAATAPAAPTRRVFLSAGEYEQFPDPARSASADRLAKLEKNRMVDNARELAGRLAALSGAPLHVTFTVFPGENHGSVVPGAIARALPFVFTHSPPAVAD